MDRESQYRQKRQKQPRSPSNPGFLGKLRRTYEDGRAGWQAGSLHSDYTDKNWDALDQQRQMEKQRLFETWLKRNPGKNEHDFDVYWRSLPKLPKTKWNWLQKRVFPSNIRRKLDRL